MFNLALAGSDCHSSTNLRRAGLDADAIEVKKECKMTFDQMITNISMKVTVQAKGHTYCCCCKSWFPFFEQMRVTVFVEKPQAG